MARRANGGNKKAKNNGHRIVTKDGGTLSSSRIDQQELSPLGSTNGKSEAFAEGHDSLHQQIAERAYVLYERSGFQDGHDLEHWLEAERQIKRVRDQAA